jgi:S1-C subfamily serine protease
VRIVSICLLLVLGIALDSSWTAAEVVGLSRGTGFFVSKDGRLLTNFHVINSCRQLTVQSGRLSGAARVVATDGANDLALLAANLKPVRTVPEVGGTLTSAAKASGRMWARSEEC